MPHVLSCSEACGFFPNQGSNLCHQPGHSTVPPRKSQTIKLYTDFELLRGSVFLTPMLLKGLLYSKSVCKIKNILYDVMELILENSSLDLGLPMDCSLPGSSIHGIFQAGVLEWGAIAYS